MGGWGSVNRRWSGPRQPGSSLLPELELFGVLDHRDPDPLRGVEDDPEDANGQDQARRGARKELAVVPGM